MTSTAAPSRKYAPITRPIAHSSPIRAARSIRVVDLGRDRGALGDTGGWRSVMLRVNEGMW
ncbi:hypothetical protein GCM10027419_40620 [Pandoraea terrae]